MYVLETDDIIFLIIFDQFLIFYWPPIPIFHNLPTDIFANILNTGLVHFSSTIKQYKCVYVTAKINSTLYA